MAWTLAPHQGPLLKAGRQDTSARLPTGPRGPREQVGLPPRCPGCSPSSRLPRREAFQAQRCLDSLRASPSRALCACVHPPGMSVQPPLKKCRSPSEAGGHDRGWRRAPYPGHAVWEQTRAVERSGGQLLLRSLGSTFTGPLTSGPEAWGSPVVTKNKHLLCVLPELSLSRVVSRAPSSPG